MDGYRFRNWAETYECHPHKYFQPNDLDQLRSIVHTAQVEGKKIRLAGFGHSPSDLCCTDDFMVSLKNFNRILAIDEKRQIVSLQAGVLLKDLVQFLKQHNLAISTLPTVGELTIAGIISTCTHGSGVNYPGLADYVTSLTLLTAEDQLITCSRHDNADIFHAVCGGLGTLGIILTVDMQCEAYYNLKYLRYPMHIDHFIQSMDELCQECDHFKAHYFPYTDQVAISQINRSRVEPTPKPNGVFHRWTNWFWYTFMLVYVLEFLYYITVYLPFTVKYVNRFAYRLFFSHTEYLVDGYENVSFFNCLFHQYVSEWAIGREHCSEALRQLKEIIESKKIAAHFLIEVRYVRHDSFWLSPAYERDVCYINIMVFCPYDKKPEHAIYWQVFEHIMKSFNGRPHLAKDHSYTAEDMHREYPRFDDFLELRKQMDKKNIFVNGYIKRTFGIE